MYSALPRVLDARVVNRGDRFRNTASGRVVMLAEVTDLEFAEEVEKLREEEEVEVEMEEESGEESGSEGLESENGEGAGIENVEESEGTDREDDEDAVSEEDEESRHSLGCFEVTPDEEGIHLGPTLRESESGLTFVSSSSRSGMLRGSRRFSNGWVVCGAKRKPSHRWAIGRLEW